MCIDTCMDTVHTRGMTTNRIDSLLATDLAESVAIDLMETGATHVVGPFGMANIVVNAIEKAGRTIGQNVTWTRTQRGWLAAVTA